MATAQSCCAPWPTRWAPDARRAWYVDRVPADVIPDDELARAIGAGGDAGRSCEAELCRRFAPRIRLYGLRHLRDDDRARELVQTVLLGVLEAARAGRIDDPGKLDRFVLGTCRNAVLRMRDVDARGQRLADAAVDAAVAAEPVEIIDRRALVRCLDALDARAKKVVVMTFHGDRSADEIGAALAMAAGAVRVVRHRALAALRRCLDRPPEEAGS